MYNLSRTFDTNISAQRKGQYGQQVSTSTKYGFVQKGQVNYNKCPQWKQAEAQVNNFITQKGNQADKFKMFKSILRQKIVDGKQRTKGYNLNQIADFLPWAFSTQFLFEPFRSILYCLKTNIDPIHALVVSATIPSQLINNVVDQAILQSIKYQSPYIQMAKDIFSKNHVGLQTSLYAVSVDYLAAHMAYLQKAFQEAIKANDIYKSFSESVALHFKAFAQYFIGTKGNQFFESIKSKYTGLTGYKEKVQGGEWKQTVLTLVQQMFKHLRPYGKIVINFGYLKHCAQAKNVGGKQFYYFWDHPQLLITCRQSLVEVYLNTNGQLTLIPEQRFDIDFLRQVVMNDVIKMGGRLFKQLNYDTTKTIEEKQPLKTFSSTYLKWKSTQQSQKTKSQNAMITSMAGLMGDIRSQQYKK